MISPNKFLSFEESILINLTFFLKHIPQDQSPISINELFFSMQSKFENVDEFLYALDVLFVLDKILVNFEEELVYRAFRNRI